ncbi:PAS domain-containing protein [Hymenobacter sp.]|uniref:PAS domain-containing protein n=1 Tax=Hymenobacter sp. TaxID=1898978 RepID=UPI002ED860EF
MKPSASSIPLFTAGQPGQPAAEGQVEELKRELAATRQREQQLRAQRDFYADILQELPVEVVVLDQHFRYVYANPQAVPDEEARTWLLGHTILDYCQRYHFPVELAEQRRRVFDEALREQHSVTWEDVTPYPEGPRSHRRYFKPMARPAGEPPLMLGYGLDITEQLAAEVRSLHNKAMTDERQTLIQQITDASPQVVYVRDAQGQLIFRNRAFNELAARSHHVRTPQQLNLTEAVELHQWEAAYREVLQHQQPVSRESSCTLADESVLWFQISKLPLPQPDGTVHVLTIGTDITEIKEARQTLERSTAQYRDLLAHTQALIGTHDLQGRLLSVNPAIEELMGLPAAAIVGCHLTQAVPPELRAGVQHYLSEIKVSKHSQEVMKLVNQHDEQHYILFNNFKVDDPGKEPYVVAYGQVITERVVAERELRRAKREAEANARAKENFLANMSHEIRTPMNGVLGMASQLAKTPLDAQQRQYLDTILASGRNLLAVLNDVLDMAKISAGKLELEHIPFDLSKSIRTAAQTLAYRAAEKNLIFDIQPLSLTEPVVLSDPYRLNQVLLNLLSNAIKFTEQGSVTLGSDLLRETSTAVTIRFWVRDTGIGIPADKQQQIFENFTQAYADTSRRFGGTGLGLTISRSLVQQLGGELELSSTPGQGTWFAFTLTLPKAPIQQAPPVPTPPDYNRLRGTRVLLAEDSATNRQLTTLILKNWGIAVDSAVNGPDALALFQTRDYDVILMDIQMPGMSGIEVTEAIRLSPDPARADIPIIALTANAFRTDREQYLQAGMNDCLTKPFEEADLYHKLVAQLFPVENSISMPAPLVAMPALVDKAPSAAPLFDLTQLEKNAHGNQEFMRRMINVFLTEIPVVAADLTDAAAAKDWLALITLAHKLKSSLKLFQVSAAFDDLHILEEQQASPDTRQVAARRLSELLERVCAALQLAVG